MFHWANKCAGVKMIFLRVRRIRVLVIIKNRYINIYNISYIEIKSNIIYNEIHMSNGEIIEINDKDFNYLVAAMHIR